MATRKKLDAALMLQKLAEIRKAIPDLQSSPRRKAEDGRTRMDEGFQPRTAEDFEWAALADGLQGFADDLRATIEQKEAQAMAAAMEIYYRAEELARDPEHANLIPHVEKMRAEYQRFYGRPIPPKPKK